MSKRKRSVSLTFLWETLIEAPVLDPSSISASRAVSETELPGFLIGTPLTATDAEVDVGLQQLTWSTTKCEALKYDRTGGSDVWEDVTPLKNCDIKLSACDGQLSVAERTDLNYEEYTRYRLKVKATDDGNPNLDSTTVGTVYIDVLEQNDPPDMDDVQYFYIKENSPDNTFVDLKNVAGDPCAGKKTQIANARSWPPTQTPWTPGFKFIQDPSQDPFVITKKAVGGQTTTYV